MLPIHSGRCSSRETLLPMDEGRKHKRVRMRCAVALWDPRKGHVTRTDTENLSCDGFYCVCSEPYAPGEELEASLEVPCRYWNGRPADCLILQCKVEVVRVVLHSSRDDYEVACRIRDYAIIAIRRSSDLLGENTIVSTKSSGT